MLDRAPTKPNRYAVYDDAHNFLRYEYHERADEPTQVGDALNKANLLSDATAAKLNGVETPNAAFGLLSRFHAGMGNEYMWSKTDPYVLSLSATKTGGALSTFTGFYYADDVLVNSATGEITYVNPQAMSGFPGTAIVNKYVYHQSDTRIAWFMLSVTVSGSEFSSYTYKSYSSTRSTTVYGYVNSPDSAAYPPSVSDGYTYTPLGQIGSRVQIATGTYDGTGTFGESNPNSLTFPFAPIIFEIVAYRDPLVFPLPDKNLTCYTRLYVPFVTTQYTRYPLGYDPGINSHQNAKKSSDSKTIYWYVDGAAASGYTQFNKAGNTYAYFAIG